MNQLTLQYNPFNLLPARTINVQIPSSWSDLSARQLQFIPLIRRGLVSSKAVIRRFFGLKRSIVKRMGAYQRYQLIQQLEFINSPEPVSSFKIRRLGTFIAPADKLKNVTFGQFIYADTFFSRYMQGEKDMLNNFIACMYLRKSFSEKNVERDARIIALLPLALRESISINYILIREWLAVSYPYVFEKPVQTSGKKKINKISSWIPVFDNLVGSDIVNSDRYAERPVNEIFRYLNKQRKDYLINGRNVR